MKNSIGKRAAALFLAALCLFMLASAALAVETAYSSALVVLSYRILQGGNAVSKVVRGNAVSVELVVKNTAMRTSERDAAFPIDVSRIVDSFSAGGSVAVEIQSQNDEALQMKLTFPDCVYSGSGKAFRFMVGCRKTGEASAAYAQGEISVLACEEYVEPAQTAVIPAPTVSPAPAAIPAPALHIARSDVPTLSAGDEAVVTLSFTNMGVVSMEDALMSVGTSDSLLLLENTASFPVGNLPPGRTVNIPMRFKAAKTIAAEQQTITVEAKFLYYNGETRVQGTASDKLTLLAKTTAADAARPDGPQPNIILQKYTFGDGSGQAAAGSEFDLSLHFMNTSAKRKVENVVMTIEPGEGLGLSNSTNTFYYAAIDKEEAKSETVKLLALPTAKPGAAEVTLSFKYEYVDNNKRTPVTLTQKLSIQLFQPDRFDVTLNTLPESMTVGEESSVSLNYMNKGKSSVSNVQAKLEGNVSALGSLQNIGNLEPGKSGTINFVLTPQEAGEVKCTITVTYEDAGGKVQTKEIPLSVMAEEFMFDPMMAGEIEVEEPEKKGGALWYIAIGVALCGVGAAILLRKKRMAKKKGRKSSYEWKDDMEA